MCLKHLYLSKPKVGRFSLRAPVTIIALIAFSVTGQASNEACKAAVNDGQIAVLNGIAMVQQNQSIRKVAAYNEAIQTGDFQGFSNREKMFVALIKTYSEDRKPETLFKLLDLGFPKTDLIENLIIPSVKADLLLLESDHPVQSLPSGSLPHQMIAVNRSRLKAPGTPLTLTDFSTRYGLDHLRKIISENSISTTFTSANPFLRRMGKTLPTRALKAALLTNDRLLIERALNQAIKYGLYEEVTAIAAETQHNSVLIDLGMLSLSRYLFFDRNHNWLRDALRAFAEVKRPDRDNLVALMYDLYDLMRSSNILENEKAIRTYGNEGDVENYQSQSLEVLIASLPVVRREAFDSSARFNYIHESSRDPEFTSRLIGQLKSAIASHLNLSEISEAIRYVKDEARLLEMRDLLRNYEDHLPTHLDKNARAMMLMGFKYFRDNLEAQITKMAIPNADVLSRAEEPRAATKVIPKVAYWHEESIVDNNFRSESGLARTQGFFPSQKEAGGASEPSYWQAMLSSIKAGDLVGLNQVFEAMMHDGRAIDAYYAAFAMERISGFYLGQSHNPSLSK